MRDILVVDGTCVFCNWLAMFMRHDRAGRFGFTHQQSACAKRALERHGLVPDAGHGGWRTMLGREAASAARDASRASEESMIGRTKARAASCFGLLAVVLAMGCEDTTTSDGDGGVRRCRLGGRCGELEDAGEAPQAALEQPCIGLCGDEDERPEPGARPTCPEQEPLLGAECDEDELKCSYGDAPYVQCRSYFVCRDGAWVEPSNIGRVECEAAMDAASECPDEAPERSTRCEVLAVGAGVPCTYEALRCFCRNELGQPGTPGSWVCEGAPNDERCPAILPNLGEGCGDEDDLACNYTATACHAQPFTAVACADGMWVEGETAHCPL